MMKIPCLKTHTVEAVAAKTWVGTCNYDRRTIGVLYICLSDMSGW